jgi:multidrug efflux pump subunit AcrA (membrane-fusion protein)
VLQATSTTRQATAEVDATQLPDVTPGAPVSITLPDNQATPGVVTSVGTVAGGAPSGSAPSGSGSSGSGSASGGAGSSGASVSVDISLSDPAAAGTLDEAPVEVSITTATVPDALAVPVDALLAQPGGYAVEVAGADGARHLVTVSLGLFDDAAGLVQVSGPGLAAGQRVVVPQI